MKTIKTKLYNVTAQEIGLIADFLKRGKIIVYPTDTVYGLGCLSTEVRAIERINKIKKRKKQQFIILVNSLTMAKKYCHICLDQKKFLNKVWPGPVTAILRKKKNLPDELTGGLETVAVRYPKNEYLIKLIKKIRQPIVSTSLNISGQPVIENLILVKTIFKENLPDFLIDAGKLKRKKTSRIVDIIDINNIKILRK